MLGHISTDLKQEITLLSRLSHPNIVQYYGSELVWIKIVFVIWKFFFFNPRLKKSSKQSSFLMGGILLLISVNSIEAH